MINITWMKPFYTKISGDKLRIVFAYQYLNIEKDGDVYHFIPIEGKEIIYNLKNRRIENLEEVFVFQRGNQFIRMTLAQFVSISNLFLHMTKIIKEYEQDNDSSEEVEFETSIELKTFFEELEHKNSVNALLKAIDKSLDQGNKELFYELTDKLNGFKMAVS